MQKVDLLFMGSKNSTTLHAFNSLMALKYLLDFPGRCFPICDDVYNGLLKCNDNGRVGMEPLLLKQPIRSPSPIT